MPFYVDFNLPNADTSGLAWSIGVSTNKDPNDGRLQGETRQRSQSQHPNGHWVKRDTESGQFVGVKHDDKPFKYVRREQ